MTQLQTLRKALLSQLADKLRPRGLKRKEQDFCKVIPGVEQVFHIAFIKHKDDFDLSADVAVRHNTVENLVHEFESTVPRPAWAALSKKDQADTATVGAELGNLSIGRPRYWTVRSEADLTSVCEGVLDAFEKIGGPYLERFSSLEEVLTVLSGDDKDSWIHCPFNDVRAKKAIAAAFLLGRRETFEKLVESKTLYFKDRKDPSLPAFIPPFTAFAEYLAKRWE